MTPQEIAQSGLLPGTPVVRTRMVQIGSPLVAWFEPRTIFMHPVDWWVVFTERDIWESVVIQATDTFDTKWERAKWREIGEDR